MKKKGNIVLVLLIICCFAAFYAYKTLDAVRTDNDAPAIYMDAKIPEISVKDPKSALMQGISAEDRTDGDVTASLVVESIELISNDGQIKVKYAAFDKAGNVAKVQREAKYTDYKSPKFSMAKPVFFQYGADFDMLKIMSAEDVIDGDIQHRIRATMLDGGSIAELGIHTVRFQVTNSLGDATTLEIPVEVYDPELYDAALTLKTSLLYLDQGSSFSPEAYLDTYTYRGTETNLQRGLPENFSLKTEGKVDTKTPGTYSVKLLVTYTLRNEADPSRNQEYVAGSRLTVVVEG